METKHHMNHDGEEIKQSVVVENGGGASRWLPISIIIAGLIIAGSNLYTNRQLINYYKDQTAGVAAQNTGTGQQGQAAGGAVQLQLKGSEPYLGNKDAKVTVVEYADYQCPFCEKFFKEVYPQLKSQYIDTGKIKFIYQDFAFLGPDSTAASEAAHCAADQGKFWQYHEYLFSNQGQENGGWATADKQKQFAKSLGLNTSQFNSCLDTHKYQQAVQDETSAGKSAGVTGTPTVFVNGKAIVGAQPFSSFQQAIDAALK